MGLPKLFHVGIREMYIFKSVRHCQNKKNMYCKNVSNYTIKMHVFDYLTYGRSFLCWESPHYNCHLKNVTLDSTSELLAFTVNQPFSQASYAVLRGSTLLHLV